MTLKKLGKILFSLILLVSICFTGLSMHAYAVTQPAPVAIGSPCDPASGGGIKFLTIPHWYQYLKGAMDGGRISNGTIVDQRCVPQLAKTTTKDENGNDVYDGGIDPISIWLIGLAVVEILLRVVGLIVVAMVVFGGFQYITSQGNADATKTARGTIVNAFVGMVITIIAAISVNFIAILIK